MRRIYSEDYYRKNKWLVPIMDKLTKPISYDHFFVQADAIVLAMSSPPKGLRKVYHDAMDRNGIAIQKIQVR